MSATLGLATACWQDRRAYSSGIRIGGAELTFLANPRPEPVTATVRREAPVGSVYEPHAEIRPSGLSGPVVLRASAP